MKSLLVGGVAALAAIAFAPSAQANPSQGDQCMNWHATTTDNNGSTLYCTHLPQSDPSGGSGHIMYWESSIRDSSYRSGGFKNDPIQPAYPHNPGGPPCDQRQGRVLGISPAHNAIEDWGPPGCDLGKPMVG